MKIVFTTFVWIVTIMSGAGLFWTSTQVQIEESERATLNLQIAETQDRLQILSAEWHYLNNPTYLEQITQAVLVEEKDIEGIERPLILASTNALPNIEGTLLPVRRPYIPMQPVELAAVVAQAESQQPIVAQERKSSRLEASERSPSSQNFGYLLASWTE